MIEQNEISKDWRWVKLGEACEVILGQSPPSTSYNNDGIGLPFFQGKAEFTDLHPIVEKWCNEPNKIAEPNDILLSVRAPVGTTNIADQKCCIGRGLAAIRFDNYKYAFYFLRSRQHELDSKGTGTTFRAISGETVRETLFPLPPKPTQQAIVSKIEELFSELDKGIEQLKTSQQQLKTYRQAVLKWAFEGKLTSLNHDLYDLPDEHDLNIAAEPKVEYGNNNRLPKGWKMKKLSEVGTWKGGGTPSKSNKAFWENGNILWVSPKDMKSKVIHDTIDKITLDAIENSSAKLIKKGSILFVVRSGILRRTLPVAITISDVTVNQDLQAFTPNEILSDYVYWYVQAKNEEIRKECSKDGTTVESIESSLLKNYLIPVCSKKEQNKIVQEIERRLSVADKMEESINQSLQQTEALRQTILKKAFEGRLVATDTIETVKQNAKVIPFERKVLAGKIIHLLYDDNHFGLTKFQKIFYLVENFAEVAYETNFIQDRAGPYDKEFTTAFRREMQEKDWVQEEQKRSITKFIPGKNIGSLISKYATYFRDKGTQITFVLKQLKAKSTHEAELIATLYAVWNNRLIKKKPVKVELLIEDFFSWSPKKKEEFQKEEVINTYKWMKEIRLLPKGFGKIIEPAKG